MKTIGSHILKHMKIEKKKYLGSPPEIFDKSVTWDPSSLNWVIIAPALYTVETVLDDLQPLVPTEKPV